LIERKLISGVKIDRELILESITGEGCVLNLENLMPFVQTVICTKNKWRIFHFI
jgi:hypothetical protein